jgi:hypothetical protein
MREMASLLLFLIFQKSEEPHKQDRLIHQKTKEGKEFQGYK